MNNIVHVKRPSSDQSAVLCRLIAAAMPALIIGYSAIVDPLVNYNLAPGTHFGGIEVGHEGKSRALTKVIMPGFLVLSMAFAFISRPIVPRRLRLLLLPGTLLIMLACVSALWAKAPTNTLTLGAYQAILFASLMITVAVADDPRRVITNMLLMFALVVLINLAAVAVRPPGSDGHLGIYNHKNTLGAAAGCALLFGLFGLFENGSLPRIVALFTTLGAAVLTVVSGSKTALALIAAAPLIAVTLYISYRFLALGSILAMSLLSALLVSGYFIVSRIMGFDLDDVLHATYGDATFTGRTGIWSFAYDFIERSPILGNGYRGFWSLGSSSPKHGSEVEFIRTIGSGHNGFVDMTLDLGLAGLGLLLVFILIAVHFAGRFRMRPPHRSLLYLSMIIFLLGRNMMESVLLWSTQFDNLCFLLVCFLACYPDISQRGRRLVVKRPARSIVGAGNGVASAPQTTAFIRYDRVTENR